MNNVQPQESTHKVPVLDRSGQTQLIHVLVPLHKAEKYLSSLMSIRGLKAAFERSLPLKFLYCLGIISLLLNCAGCLTTPPSIRTHYNIPADRYDYLDAAVNCDICSRDVTNDTQKVEMQNMSRKLYDVWKNPQKYKFSCFSATWTSSQVKYVRDITHHKVLAHLEFVLKLYESVPFEQDVHAAVKELKNERGAPILEPDTIGN